MAEPPSPIGSVWEHPLKIVDVVFHDGHVEQMMLEDMWKLPYDHEDVSNFGDDHRTFALGLHQG